ncbi:RING1 and YY1-binding protein [Tetranychus urticae]|uniref:RanBP2-type domain-containing protein n=1 Tax=Tetranychus urticae TaxID=32264 RepID=T1K272_TETUR|nr:RING1 and YY1-binding protein [Tetranychus urticae]
MVNSKTDTKDMEKVESPKEERNTKKSAKNRLSKSLVVDNLQEDSGDGANSGEDDNTWDCTVCTFKNPAEAFKCLMCDVRKGTSTRKPRINPELVAQQVARQQQHLLLKISHGRTRDGNKEGNGRNDSDGNSRDGEDRRDSKIKDSDADSGAETKKERKQTKHRKSLNNDGNSPGPSSHNNKISNRNSLGSTGRLKKSRKDAEAKSPSVAALLASNHPNNLDSSSSSSTSSLLSSATTTASSSSKNGLTSKLKNIDRNNCSSEAVTVNNVTVIITEFLSDLKDGQNDRSPSKNVHCLGTKQKKEAH